MDNRDDTVLNIDDMAAFNAVFHQPVYHPMVGVGRLSHADTSCFVQVRFGMYCLLFVEPAMLATDDGCRGARGHVRAVMPGQVVSLESGNDGPLCGWALAFVPELLIKTGLGRDFYMFNFFTPLEPAEASLSDDEASVVRNGFENIFNELCAKDDHLTGHMLRLGIGMLLSHCKRIFESWAEEGKKTNSLFMQKLDDCVESYLSSGLPEQKGLLTVGWCAEQFGWTPNYFGNMVKKELGITARDFVQAKIVDAARAMLVNTRMSVTEVAQQLGFAYPNHFTRLFCKKMGMTPLAYRRKGEMDR